MARGHFLKQQQQFLKLTVTARLQIFICLKEIRGCKYIRNIQNYMEYLRYNSGYTRL